MANKVKGFFDDLKHQLGGTPASDDVVKAKNNEKPNNAPKDVSQNTPQSDAPSAPATPPATPLAPVTPVPDVPKDDKPNTQENKPRRMTESEVIKLLEERGYSITKNDAQPTREAVPTPAPVAPLPSPAPAPAPQYFEAHDTTPKVYQNPHLGVRMMQPNEFYGGMAENAYEFDRLFGHGAVALDPGVISWIGSLFPDVPELAEDIVKNRLRDILRKNPGLIPTVKQIARETTVETIPYAATFVSKLDYATEYESEKDAEAAMAPYKAIGATMQSTYAIRYRKRHYDGSLGEIVDPKVVIEFAKNYDGDLDKLCYDLWLSRSKVENSDTSNAGGNASN